MSDTALKPTNSAADPKPQSLDDVMMAMDVVDTLRHRSRLVETELNAGDRRAELIDRLKEIYASQGIEVTEEILAEGVKALEESRFTYEPPKPSFKTKLAHLYISRGRWMRIFLLIGVLTSFLWGVFYVGVERPRQQTANQIETRLTRVLPMELAQSHDLIASIAKNPIVVARGDKLYKQGQAQLAARDSKEAEATLLELDRIATTLQQEYTIRVVNRVGENSGVWRVPDNNPTARNFYLIVEGVTPAGQIVNAQIMSEETGVPKTVKKWGIRVDEATMNRIRNDKSDDGIIQSNIVGRKALGELEPSYTVITDGGKIWEW